ncbi:unnamed protein product [Linum tenue]|uniref:Uncharacterized protein n=1 Tax=Linum tenue TaxID=586396 RepID=A0AAV0KJ56_9ROSI|nr:unnamed protein product [Linum tenue]
MLRARHALTRLKHRWLCTSTAKPNNGIKKNESGGNNGGDNHKQPSSITRYNETYSQLGKLDFMTAAKILFTETPKQKKFGTVQPTAIDISREWRFSSFFFYQNCWMNAPGAELHCVIAPYLAVYLAAMYARREMDRVEMEFQQKKKKEEETKAKEEEQKALEVEAKSNAAISEVKERLDKLEVAVNEIAADKKKGSSTGTKDGGSSSSSQDRLRSGNNKS